MNNIIYLLKFYAITNFLIVIYYTVKLYILKMYANNKEYINPEEYPKLIKNELMELKNITINSTPIELAKVYKHYYFLIGLYVFIVLLCLTALVIHSIFV